MAYEVIVVTPQHHGHLERALKHINRNLENPHLESLWRKDLGHHRHEYVAHVKTGHLGNHHHFTVVWVTHTQHHEEKL